MMHRSTTPCCLPPCFWWRRSAAKCWRSAALPLRIAYLNTEDAQKWEDQRGIFAASLSLPLSSLQQFDCHKGEFPTKRDLEQFFDGVIITGSHYSAVDPKLTWLPELFSCIRDCAAIPGLGVVACCFGAQACTVALGGEVGPNPDGKFVFGWTELQLAQAELARHPWARQALGVSGSIQSPIGLLQSHGDQVLRLPPGASLLGWSEGTPHELFLCGQHRNVLCCQAHPEFYPALMMERIAPSLRAKGRLSDEQLAEQEFAMTSRPSQSSEVCAAYRNFLLQRRRIFALWQTRAVGDGMANERQVLGKL